MTTIKERFEKITEFLEIRKGDGMQPLIVKETDREELRAFFQQELIALASDVERIRIQSGSGDTAPTADIMNEIWEKYYRPVVLGIIRSKAKEIRG